LINIFISRDLSPDSVFKQLLAEQGINVIGTSLIEFKPLSFGRFKEVDWIFFYSKNGVRYFFEGLEQVLLPTIRFATMGIGTAKALQKYGYTAAFIGTGIPSSTASAFLQIAAQQRVLFPRAKTSQRSIQQALGVDLQMEEVIVYTNTPKSTFQLPVCAYVVFTSPLNVQAYFSKKKLEPGQRIVAIGNTTALALNEIGFFTIFVAEKPTEKAMAALILKQLT